MFLPYDIIWNRAGYRDWVNLTSLGITMLKYLYCISNINLSFSFEDSIGQEAWNVLLSFYVPFICELHDITMDAL